MKGRVQILALLFTLLAWVGWGWDNLDYGLPGTNDIVVLEQEGYACGYDTNRKQAAWVSYRLTAEEAAPRVRVARTDCFRADARLGKEGVTPDDYRGSGYDKGHLAPAGDMMWSESAMRDSFLMSNMSPQRPAFNRGIWRELEYWVRECARTNGSVFVVTGPVFVGGEKKVGGESRSTADGSLSSNVSARVSCLMSHDLPRDAACSPRLQAIGKHGVMVPWGYYKVVLVEGERTRASAPTSPTHACLGDCYFGETVTNKTDSSPARVRAIGFLLPNRGSTNALESFLVPLSAVEAATGLRFFREYICTNTVGISQMFASAKDMNIEKIKEYFACVDTMDYGTREGALKGWITRRRNATCVKPTDHRQIAEMKDRVKDWLSTENLNWARGKDRDTIFKYFGNELKPISYIDRMYLDYLKEGIVDNRVYSGKGYLIEHAVNHHPELSADEYSAIQDVIDNPDDVKLDDERGRRSLIFIRQLDKHAAVVVGVSMEDDDKIVYHKTFFKRSKNAPYQKMRSILAEKH